MNETEAPIAPPPGRRKRKRLLLAAVGLLTILFALGLGWLFRGHWQLREAIAEADRLDPGWRWDELEARRENIADGENSASHVLAAKLALPPTWPSPATDKVLREADPFVRLDSAQLGLVERDLTAAAAALPSARLLADFPKGRFTHRPAPVLAMVNCSEIQDAHTVNHLLCVEAVYRAEKQEPGMALAACRAGLNAGRAIGDWPAAIGLMVRIACQGNVLNAVERTLAQTEPKEADLAALQRLLEDEAVQPLLLNAVRGERAMSDDLFDAFQSGRINGSDVSTAFGMATGPLNVHGYRMEFYLRDKARRAECLRNNTQLVEIAKQPVEAQNEALEEFQKNLPEDPFRNVPLFGEMMEGGKPKWMFAFLRSQARLRAMIALLAAERFRLAHGRWPNGLDELCPDFLQAVPLDPSDGKPLRLRRLPDGLVIYAIGADRQDHGGTLNRRNIVAPGSDYGFQFWDTKQRRQPPAPGEE